MTIYLPSGLWRGHKAPHRWGDEGGASSPIPHSKFYVHSATIRFVATGRPSFFLAKERSRPRGRGQKKRNLMFRVTSSGWVDPDKSP